jgi:hypothetical protein
MAVTWKKLAYETDCVLKTLYDAYSILAADTDNTPAALTVGASTIVGRKASGGIVALSASEALTILAHALSAHSNAVGNVPFNGYQGTDFVVHTVANEAAVAAYATPVLGKLLWATSEASVWICTVAA